MTESKMVVVDGVRYRAEDAPKRTPKAPEPEVVEAPDAGSEKASDDVSHKARRVSGKAETK